MSAVAGNLIYLDTTCSPGLEKTYRAAGRTQVVRVPQYSTLTVDPGASVTGPPWDGQRGGVVAVHVQSSLIVDGSITADALGFRGGSIDNASAASGSNITTYRSTTAANGAEKGEGIAGSPITYDRLGGRYGRGSPANGGGGGNPHGAGGGGGANGNDGSAFSGQGVMLTTVLGAAA